MGRPRIPLDARFWAQVDSRGSSDCWLWTGWKPNGYGVITSGGSWPFRQIAAHRFSWELHRGPIPAGLCVLHHCDTPACVNPAHLFLGTRSDNSADKVAKNRVPRGSVLPQAKITEADVIEIRARVANGERQRDLALAFGLDQSSISHIVSQRTWRHVG